MLERQRWAYVRRTLLLLTVEAVLPFFCRYKDLILALPFDDLFSLNEDSFIGFFQFRSQSRSPQMISQTLVDIRGPSLSLSPPHKLIFAIALVSLAFSSLLPLVPPKSISPPRSSIYHPTLFPCPTQPYNSLQVPNSRAPQLDFPAASRIHSSPHTSHAYLALSPIPIELNLQLSQDQGRACLHHLGISSTIYEHPDIPLTLQHPMDLARDTKLLQRLTPFYGEMAGSHGLHFWIFSA